MWLALLWLARVLWRVSARWMMGIAGRLSPRVKVGGGELFARDRTVELVRRAMAALAIATMFVLTWEWLGYVLALFPYTRPWAEGLTGFLVRTSVGLLEAIAHAAPSLFVAALIFVIAWAVNRVQKRFFDRVEAGRITIGSIDRDTAPATRRLATIAIWMFAAVMAYPYIPGSDTDAFKGLSVLLGLMVSVGASGIVGQAAAGLILMYTRTFRTGEYVRVGDREGTLTRMGLFTSTMRTGRGEELTLPNSQILASVTTNYTRVVDGPGFIAAAKVSIGYDAPWRQVHAMLIEAAKRVEGVLDTPPPTVFQTSLDDFYVQYRLVCQRRPRSARARAARVGAERVDPGRVQRERRADHVAALPRRSGRGQGRAAQSMVRAAGEGRLNRDFVGRASARRLLWMSPVGLKADPRRARHILWVGLQPDALCLDAANPVGLKADPQQREPCRPEGRPTEVRPTEGRSTGEVRRTQIIVNAAHIGHWLTR
ncbi:MAG: mechanosensitive ion channel [Betaproteobacteria bacterium]|nr:mechanosensitive ion channel [Betaproteobacteria bacterium]